MWNPVSGLPLRRLGTALRFPFRADDYVLTLLVGVLLLEFGYLLLPAFVYMGYQVDVLRRTAMGADRPPSFENWIGLLLDGGKAFLVGFGFLVNPATVAAALLGVYLGVSVEQLLALAGEIPLEEIAGLPIAVLVGDQAVVRDVLAFVDRVLALGAIGYASVAAFGVVAYVFPAALVRFALDEEHSIDAARDLGVLAGVVRSPRYLATWLVVLGLYAVQSAAVWVPLQFSVGVDLAPRSIRTRLWQDLLYLVAYAVVFHLQLGAAYLVGRRYRELRRAGATDQPVVGLAQRVRARLAGFLRERVSAGEGDAASAEAESTGETKVADASAQTPQKDGVLASLRRRLYGPIAYPAGESVTAMLLIGALAVTQGVGLLPLVVSSGLLVRVLRSGRGETADIAVPRPEGPTYARWGRLLADGTRTLSLWAIATVPAIFLAVLWTAIGGTVVGPSAQSRLFVILVPGVLVGALGPLSLYFYGLGEASLVFWSVVFRTLGVAPAQVAALDVPVGAGLLALLAVEGYLFPAAVANVAERRRLSAGFSPTVLRRALTRRYLRGWLACVAVAAAGFAPYVWWLLNSTALGAGPGGTGPISLLDPALEQYLLPLPLGFLPVSEVLTPEGAAAHLLYPVVSFVYFYAQAVAFSVVGRAWSS